MGQSRVARAPGAPCLCRLSQESFRVSSVILCFLFSPPSLCCLSQAVLWSMIRFQLQAAAVSLVGAGFKAFLSLVLHKRKCSWLEDDGKEVGHRQCGICNSWYGWVAMFWALDVWDDMRMLYEDLAMKM